MASDHRGQPLHAGKRTNDEMHVSRLATLMARQDARGYPNSKNKAGNPKVAQSLLNDYRDYRDGGATPYQLEDDQEFIDNAFRNRHNPNYGTGSRGLDGEADLDWFSSAGRANTAYDTSQTPGTINY